MILLFIGPSGSGKDTQSKLLTEKGYTMISTGDLLREEREKQTERGKEIEGFLDKGLWVPDDLTYSILSENISMLENDKVILNGVVRMSSQIELLDNLLDKMNQKVDAVIYFNLPEETAIERMLGRNREDDDMERIKSRLSEFKKDVENILNQYSDREILFEIDASESVDTIHNKILGIISDIN